MKKKIFDEFVGGFGALSVLAAYAFLNFEILKIGIVYQGMNLFGAILIMYDAVSKKAKQPAILNFIWAIIAIIGILGAIL